MTGLIEEEEEWRPVVGYEGSYEVSDQGRVRSLDRTYLRGTTRVVIRGRLLKFVTTRSGHLSLHLSIDGVTKGFLVHRLVALAFLGPPPTGKPYVLHGPGGPADNRLSNIRWGNAAENMEDAVKDGTANFWGHVTNPKPNCPQGHPYEGDNLYIDPRGRRVCRACKREWARKKHNYKKFRV